MTYDDVKEGDTLLGQMQAYIYGGIHTGISKEILIPVQVHRVTKTQIIMQNGDRYSKRDGSAYNANRSQIRYLRIPGTPKSGWGVPKGETWQATPQDVVDKITELKKAIEAFRTTFAACDRKINGVCRELARTPHDDIDGVVDLLASTAATLLAFVEKVKAE